VRGIAVLIFHTKLKMLSKAKILNHTPLNPLSRGDLRFCFGGDNSPLERGRGVLSLLQIKKHF